jgi:outer membrane protein assembly complex protein YaeT
VEITPRILWVGEREVDVDLHINEGPWLKVTRLDLKPPPAELPLNLAEVEAKRPLKVGDRWDESTYEALKRFYLNYFLDHGYPRSKVAGKVWLDEEKDTAEIELTITSGPLCYFGEVKIKGDKEAPDRLILRKLTFKTGQPFSHKELYETQQRLYALDLFQSVVLTPEEVPETERRIPITIEVQERKKRSLRVGLGYGDEDEFRARLGLRFRNLGGGGRTLDLDGKVSSLEYRAEATFFNPLIFATDNDLVLQTGYIRRYLPGFTDKAYFTSLRLERDLPYKFRAYAGHALEFSRPFNIPEETIILLSDTTPGKLYYASMALLGIRQETWDNVADPHRGGLISLTSEFAPDFFGSTVQFVRPLAEIRRYYAPWETDFVMAGRIKFGIIQPMQNTTEIPVFRRFFAGGYNSVRGYRLDYLGPRTPSGTPVGGEALLEGSLEARIPIYKEFRAVAFLDFGNVYLKVRDLDPGVLRYSSGVGLRYHTPIGPLGVDVGFPLNPINPRQDPPYHFHFTIGQAF